MRINEGSINHNALRLIDQATCLLGDALLPEDDQVRTEMLGEVRGIILMAEAMKEVLKA